MNSALQARKRLKGCVTNCKELMNVGKRSISRVVLAHAVAAQGHVCIYCGLPFGSVVTSRSGTTILNAVADHFIPWSMGGSGYADNCVACCQKCNGSKRDLLFDSLEEARRHIHTCNRKHFSIDFIPSTANTEDPIVWAREYSQYLTERRAVDCG